MKKEIAEKMLENITQKILDNEVKADYYRFIADKQETSQSRAQYLVEADKVEVENKGNLEAQEWMQEFLKSL
jgi:hypothetical protein